MLDLYLNDGTLVRVSRAAMLALRAFDLVNFREGAFWTYLNRDRQVSDFLAQWVET